jgi:hypothetical protein
MIHIMAYDEKGYLIVKVVGIEYEGDEERKIILLYSSHNQNCINIEYDMLIH